MSHASLAPAPGLGLGLSKVLFRLGARGALFDQVGPHFIALRLHTLQALLCCGVGFRLVREFVGKVLI